MYEMPRTLAKARIYGRSLSSSFRGQPLASTHHVKFGLCLRFNVRAPCANIAEWKRSVCASQESVYRQLGCKVNYTHRKRTVSTPPMISVPHIMITYIQVVEPLLLAGQQQRLRWTFGNRVYMTTRTTTLMVASSL